MNRRALIIILTGLFAAIAAGLVVYFLLQNTRQTVSQSQLTPVTGVATARPTSVVIVAAIDIPPNSVITTSMLLTSTYPTDLISADAIRNASEVLGSTAKTSVFSGQVLLKRQFVAAQGRTGASVNIPPGKVLVAFPSTDMLNATGAVQPGDHVDIMLTIPISGTTRIDSGTGSGSQVAAGGQAIVTQGTIQNIEVYTIGNWTPPGQTANAETRGTLKVITFVVDHQEALILKYVKDSGGTIDLAVRSSLDNKTVQTDPVTIDYLVDLYGFLGIAAPQPPTP